jgi:hypothetical protein
VIVLFIITFYRASTRPENQGLGVERPEDVAHGDDEYDAYRKRMMLAYRFRPNPLVCIRLILNSSVSLLWCISKFEIGIKGIYVCMCAASSSLHVSCAVCRSAWYFAVLIFTILYFSILLHSFNTEYLFSRPSMQHIHFLNSIKTCFGLTRPSSVLEYSPPEVLALLCQFFSYVMLPAMC